ncbi:DUF1223 domain-containing protein [Pannonibacter carbonis]|uniref:DUF1223 domain-containing protein n=1 Tax=Pannonibacter carbonis TaxID=2067569 RepID=UPI000D109F3B|nr:DUF1223 domain-containing protein [Pannonibacter carbonis]
MKSASRQGFWQRPDARDASVRRRASQLVHVWPRRLVLGVMAVMLASGSALAGPSRVIELFTSQGCSSCPPADEIVAGLASDPDVLALTLPVDYWDYLGWKDTLASPENSERQRAYAARRGDRSVYTPQIVVNGEQHVVGSNSKALADALERADPLTAVVTLSYTADALEVSVAGTLPQGARMASVSILQVSPREDITVERGENSGRTITYANVVRRQQTVGMWSGGNETFRMPRVELKKTGGEKCVVLIQLTGEDGPGRIIGAAGMLWDNGM